MKCPHCLAKMEKKSLSCDSCKHSYNKAYLSFWNSGYSRGFVRGGKRGFKSGLMVGRTDAYTHVEQRLDDILRVHALRRPKR